MFLNRFLTIFSTINCRIFNVLPDFSTKWGKVGGNHLTNSHRRLFRKKTTKNLHMSKNSTIFAGKLIIGYRNDNKKIG